MKPYLTAVLVCSFISVVFYSCAYLGFHGPSIRVYPEIHGNASKDQQCLECHSGEDPQGPLTPHPNFSGCLKCHNDAVHP